MRKMILVTLHGLTAMASVFSELRRPFGGRHSDPTPTLNVGAGVGVIFFLFVVFGFYSVSAEEDVPKPEAMWEFDTLINYTTGDYGSSQTTHTVYTPLTIKRLFKQGDVGWTIPYLYQKSTPGVSALRGQAFRTSRSVSGNTRTDSGLGDMLLTGSYYLLSEPAQPFGMNLIGQIKFPTADEDKGLGTGEFDQTLGLETSKSLNESWNLYTDVYYAFIGDPPRSNLNNEFTFNIGAGYKIIPPTELVFSYKERTSLVDNEDNPRDLLFDVKHKYDETVNLLAGLSVGLSEGSPDVGVTAGASKKF